MTLDLDIKPRTAWGAREVPPIAEIPTPTPQLWLHHSAADHRGTGGVKSIQLYHVDNLGWDDIGYSFLVDRFTLAVYEGRGAGILGGHTFGHNSRSHGICVMGNFEQEHPSDELITRLGLLVAYGYGRGWWPERFSGGHRDVRQTLCPGRNLYERLGDINNVAKAYVDHPPSPGNRSPLDFTFRELLDLWGSP